MKIRGLLLSLFLTGVGLILPVDVFAGASVYFQQILPLLPAGAKIVEIGPNDDLGQQIDQILLEVLSTPSGKSFCGAVSEDLPSFKTAFFLNPAEAEQGFRKCKNYFAQKSPFKVFQKKYFAVYSDQMESAVDGWTTPHNETFLFISSKGSNPARIARTLIHELAISYDRKEQIGYTGLIDFPKLGIVEDQESCASLSILRNAEVKHTLSAARAFEMEKRISTELGIPLPEGFSAWEGLSCQAKLNFLEPYMTPLRESFAAEAMVNALMDQPLCMGTPIQFQNLKQGIQILARMTLTFADGLRRNACDYLTEGWPYYPGVSFRGGPGPRIGGGWLTLRKSSIEASKINSTSLNEQLGKLNRLTNSESHQNRLKIPAINNQNETPLEIKGPIYENGN